MCNARFLPPRPPPPGRRPLFHLPAWLGARCPPRPPAPFPAPTLGPRELPGRPRSPPFLAPAVRAGGAEVFAGSWLESGGKEDGRPRHTMLSGLRDSMGGGEPAPPRCLGESSLGLQRQRRGSHAPSREATPLASQRLAHRRENSPF